MTKNNEATPQKINEWTIMIYHSGETSLSEEFVWSLKEMVRVGTPDGVEVVALMDTISPDLWKFTIPSNSAQRRKAAAGDLPSNSSNELEEHGIFHSKNVTVDKNPVILNFDQRKNQATGDEEKAETEVKTNLGSINFASPKLLRNFVIQTIHEHRAKHYMLILSGHGHGMIGKTFLLDEGSGRFLSIPSLNWALSEVVEEIGELFKQNQPKAITPDSRIDILGFDSCGMLTAEISNLLKDEVKYIVGSQGFMQNSGWPYHLILDFLKSKPNAKPSELAAASVERCVGYYADFSRVGISIDMSAVELQRVIEGEKKSYPNWDALIQSVKNLAQKLAKYALEAQASRSNKEEALYAKHRHILNAVITAHWYAQAYAAQEYVDLQDFCEQLKLAAPKELSDECNAVIDALKNVVIKNCYAGGEFQHSHGLSIYFPWDTADEELFRYSRFKRKNADRFQLTPFNAKTLWGEFLWEFIYVTRRKPREDKGELIFMPPPGYRDHRTDHYANLYANLKNVSAEDFIISPPKFKDNPQTLRDNPQTLRDIPPGLRDNPQTLRDNPQTLRDNPQTLRDNPQTLRDNPQTLRDNPQTLRDNPQTLRDNPQTLRDNPQTLRDNPQTLRDNPQTLRDNPQTLRDNPQTLRDNPQTLRGFVGELAPFAKVKNPSMVFHDNFCGARGVKKKTVKKK